MKVAIIGGGAAGLFCAANLSLCDVTVFEKTNACGNKLLMTGGGRCNYTNCSVNFFDGVPHGALFLRSCFSVFGQKELVSWFADRGLLTSFEEERGFPETKRASSVLDLLVFECKKNGVRFKFNSPVGEIKSVLDNRYNVNGEIFDAVVLATGGQTFPKTGSSGDGNRILTSLGVICNEFKPKLGPIFVKGTKPLMGVSERVGVKLSKNGKKVCETVGDVVFTHFGISGPAALDASGLADECDEVSIDFLPDYKTDELEKKLLEKREMASKEHLTKFLSELLPKSIAHFIENATCNKPIVEMSNRDIENIVQKAKNFEFEFSGFGDFNNSWVSCGGADLKEINPKTMESKKLKNLFVVGEALDVFGLCGGYNLQIAFSTAKCAAAALEAK